MTGHDLAAFFTFVASIYTVLLAPALFKHVPDAPGVSGVLDDDTTRTPAGTNPSKPVDADAPDRESGPT